MSRVEHAAGDRDGPFPSSWGSPRGAPGSEERAGWVVSRVRQLVMLRKQDPTERRAELARKRLGP